MPTNAEYLREVPLFSRLGNASLERFAQSCTRFKLDPDETLIEEGDSASAMYILISGRVRVERITPSAETQVLGIRGPGEVIGEMSLIDGRPREARVVASTGCKFLVLHRASFSELIRSEPTAALAVMESLSLRLREADSILLSMRSHEVHERLLDFLRRHADSSGNLTLNLTQSALADHLGCSRESVSRAFAFLASNNDISRHGKVIKVRS